MACSQFLSVCNQVLEPSPTVACTGPTKKSRSSSDEDNTSDGKQLKKRGNANRVLLLGRVQELALYRAEVLRDRGFSVQVSTAREDSIRLIRRGDFDAVVLSYTLSSETVEELADEVREHCPSCPLVVIAKTALPDRKIAPDALAVADGGPKALVAALRRVLRQH